jgi:hypothetical protein
MFGFLFFAILLWPAWVPLSVWRIEKETVRRRVFAAATLVGLLFGSLLYFPLLLEPTRVSSVISGHSIAYPAAMITDPYIPRVFCCAFYTALTTLPFIISSCKRIRLLGIIVFIAAVIGYRFYSHAFISVWCFFAALLSLYIFFVIRNMETAADRNTPAEIRDPG